MAERWTIEVRHEGLGKYRVISGPDKYLVEAKAQAQQLEWEQRYQKILEKDQEKRWQIREREKTKAQQDQVKRELEEKQQEAQTRTEEAQEALRAARTILQASLKSESKIDWQKFKVHQPFSASEPKPPVYLDYPREPQADDPRYKPAFTLFDKLAKSRLEQKTQAAQELYLAEHANWARSIETTRSENDRRYAQHVAEVEQWNHELQNHQSRLAEEDAAIDRRRAAYEGLEPAGVEDYCEMVLANSEYPDSFPHDFDLEYNSETKILVLEYSLPSPAQLPRLKEVRYVKSKDQFAETFLSESESNRLYDDVLYQICLRTLHELLSADVAKALAAVSFNGWVKSIDKATGKEVNGCILSVLAKADEFRAINLQSVDPKVCFKALKGVGSSKLHGLTPVAPVLSISREDRRFVAPREIVAELAEGMNLAAMDWEDFEHLIRELFEQEFKAAGGEVKITQASRDGGVDAVAFDPDVIRGGKTVVQAKRYTNTVPVSAVRDLYGTVINEGAAKGILVTTSDYGPDSYEFAKGKPIVLLNGANLLNLLEKQGHKAKIDLKEAKKLLGEAS